MDGNLSIEGVALFILEFYKAEYGEIADRTHVQKILYYSQGYALSKLNTAIFKQHFIKHTYGPYAPSLEQFLSYNETVLTYTIPHSFKIELPNEIKEIICHVIAMKKDFSFSDLIKSTHKEDPYINTRFNALITNEQLKQFFSQLKQQIAYDLKDIHTGNQFTIVNIRTKMRHQYFTHEDDSIKEYEFISDYILDLPDKLNGTEFLLENKKKLLAEVFFPLELEYLGIGESLASLLSRKNVLLRLAYAASNNNIKAIGYLHYTLTYFLNLFTEEEEENVQSQELIKLLTVMIDKINTKLKRINVSSLDLSTKIVLRCLNSLQFEQLGFSLNSDNKSLFQYFIYNKSDILDSDEKTKQWIQILSNLKNEIAEAEIELILLQHKQLMIQFTQLKEISTKYRIGYGLVQAAALVRQGKIVQSKENVLKCYEDAGKFGYISAYSFANNMVPNLEYCYQLAKYGDSNGWEQLKEEDNTTLQFDALSKFFVAAQVSPLLNFFNFLNTILFFKE